MKILAILRDDSACNHYRVFCPLHKLAEHGMAEVTTVEEGPELSTGVALERVLQSDIIVTHRPASEEWYKFLKVLHKSGKIIVCDYDDDPFNTSPLNPYYQYIGTEEVMYQWADGSKEMLWSKNPLESGGRYLNIEQNIRRRDLFNASFKKADLVTTTTEILKSRLQKINSNVAVLPNLVNFDEYPILECKKKEIRIGWQGGASHYEDLHMVSKAVKNIIKKYDNVKFIYWGDARMYGLFREIPIDRIECHAWSKYIVYPYKLATMNLDIGLCPVIDNEFNQNKSAIKYLEYSMFKTATIASNIPPYSPVITNGKDGILVDEDGWFDAMEELILNKEKRELIGKNSYENVYENYNIDSKIYLWYDAYQKLLKQDITESVLTK